MLILIDEVGPQGFETIIDEQRLPHTQTIEFAPVPEIQERHIYGPDNQRGEPISSQLGECTFQLD